MICPFETRACCINLRDLTMVQVSSQQRVLDLGIFH